MRVAQDDQVVFPRLVLQERPSPNHPPAPMPAKVIGLPSREMALILTSREDARPGLEPVAAMTDVVAAPVVPFGKAACHAATLVRRQVARPGRRRQDEVDDGRVGRRGTGTGHPQVMEPVVIGDKKRGPPSGRSRGPSSARRQDGQRRQFALVGPSEHQALLHRRRFEKGEALVVSFWMARTSAW